MATKNQHVINMVKYIAKRNGYNRVLAIYYNDDNEGIVFQVDNKSNTDGIYRIEGPDARMIPFIPAEQPDYYQLVVKQSNLIYPKNSK